MHRSHARLAQRLSRLGGAGRHAQLLNALTGTSSGPPTTPGYTLPHSHQVWTQTGFDFPLGTSHGHAVLTVTGPALSAFPAGWGALPYGGGGFYPLQAALGAAPSDAALSAAGSADAAEQPSALAAAAPGTPGPAQLLGGVFPGVAAAPAQAQTIPGVLPAAGILGLAASLFGSGAGAGALAPTAAPDATASPQAALVAAALSAAATPPPAAVPSVPVGLPTASLFPQVGVAPYVNPALAAWLGHPAVQQQLAQLGQPVVSAEGEAAPELEAIRPFPRLAQPESLTRDGHSVTVRARGVVVCPGE